MANLEPTSKVNRDLRRHVSREYVYSLRGKFKGRGLLKALMAEKRRERVSGEVPTLKVIAI
jgi:hypothetical protein